LPRISCMSTMSTKQESIGGLAKSPTKILGRRRTCQEAMKAGGAQASFQALPDKSGRTWLKQSTTRAPACLVRCLVKLCWTTVVCIVSEAHHRMIPQRSAAPRTNSTTGQVWRQKAGTRADSCDTALAFVLRSCWTRSSRSIVCLAH
jgi:hypothetical protein